MYRLIILCSFVCGLTMGFHIPEGRILGSTDTNATYFPYQVSIEFQKNHRCSGSIIKDSWILTVASCLYGVEDITDLRVRAGSPYRGMVGEIVQVERMVPYTSFDNVTLDYDIALIKLSQALNFTKEVNTIDIGTKVPEAGRIATMSGWGTRSSGTWLTEQLSKQQMEIIYFNDCFYNYRMIGNKVTENMICAGGPGVGGCQGDSGDPLVFENELIGMMSWGFGCGERKYPSVFTNVTNFVSWINANSPN